jgi:hypothetical protein
MRAVRAAKECAANDAGFSTALTGLTGACM